MKRRKVHGGLLSGLYQTVRRTCVQLTMGQYGGGSWPKITSRKCTFLTAFVLIIYGLLTVYAVFSLWPQSREVTTDKYSISSKPSQQAKGQQIIPKRNVTIEVWGKAAIGLYFWEHIIKGPLVSKLGGAWHYGEKRIENLKFQFRTGPGVVPAKVPKETENLVLILNGREKKKVDFAQAWLDFLVELNKLKNVALVLLGNEQCQNNWVENYMAPNGGIVKVAFIVYDISNRDDDVYQQWPLGVATYRKFPNIMPLTVEVEQRRKYRCNFLGTIYKHSSREVLKKVLDSYELYEECFVKYRQNWLPNENMETSRQYHYALANSDLTLCPVGINTECYRIYEACSYGSVPVIEDVLTPGKCGKDGPLHLMKKYKAPFIFIQSWTELPKILEKEKEMSDYELADRRKMIISWYTKFKEQMRLHFVHTLTQKFDL